jgi:hypothetical protein
MPTTAIGSSSEGASCRDDIDPPTVTSADTSDAAEFRRNQFDPDSNSIDRAPDIRIRMQQSEFAPAGSLGETAKQILRFQGLRVNGGKARPGRQEDTGKKLSPAPR